MKKFVFASFIVCLVTIISPVEILADTALDVYMNDFYSKSNEASQILKEIENSLKEGSRKKVCSRQREAARLGLLAFIEALIFIAILIIALAYAWRKGALEWS